MDNEFSVYAKVPVFQVGLICNAVNRQRGDSVCGQIGKMIGKKNRILSDSAMMFLQRKTVGIAVGTGELITVQLIVFLDGNGKRVRFRLLIQHIQRRSKADIRAVQLQALLQAKLAV